MKTRTKLIIMLALTIILAFLLSYNKEKNPAKAQAFFTMGKNYFTDGKIDEAIKAYRNGLDEDSSISEGYNLLGTAYRTKYQITKDKSFRRKAIRAFKNSIDADPQNSYPYINIGSTYYYAGDKKTAAKYFKKAIDVNPRNPEAGKMADMIREAAEGK